jgi:CspA family cold shock protein
MSIGTMKLYGRRNGYGCIAPDHGSRGVFVRAATLKRAGLGSVQEDQKLSFDIERDPNNGKTSASNLKAI